jgi:hypothetical protein
MLQSNRSRGTIAGSSLVYATILQFAQTEITIHNNFLFNTKAPFILDGYGAFWYILGIRKGLGDAT